MGLRDSKAPGVRLALVFAYAHVLALLPACLVTDPVEFEVDEGSPPILIDRPQPGVDVTPLGSIFWADKGQSTTGWTFRARVYDEDVRQDLQLQWRILKHMEAIPEFQIIDLRADGVSLTREVTIFVEFGALKDSECHKLEFAVSGHFGNEMRAAYFGQPPMPFDDDVAFGEWWLLEGNRVLLTPVQAKQILDSCDALDAPVMQLGIAGQGG